MSSVSSSALDRHICPAFFDFSFLHRHDEAFSTEPARGSAQNKALLFNHVQELRAGANPAFVHYLQHFPLIFEVFGHFEKSTPPEGPQRLLLTRRMSTKLCFQQSSLVVSTPVKSKKAGNPFTTKYVQQLPNIFKSCALARIRCVQNTTCWCGSRSASLRAMANTFRRLSTMLMAFRRTASSYFTRAFSDASRSQFAMKEVGSTHTCTSDD